MYLCFPVPNPGLGHQPRPQFVFDGPAPKFYGRSPQFLFTGPGFQFVFACSSLYS